MREDLRAVGNEKRHLVEEAGERLRLKLISPGFAAARLALTLDPSTDENAI